MSGNARETALLTLSACDRQGAWSDLALKKNIRKAGLDSRDAALATRLCFGVIQNRLLLDYYIGKFSSIRLERIENRVLNAIRLGLYQMAFLTRIPLSAAVNESVELVKRYSKNPRSPGLVNGILRALARNLDRLPTIPESDPVSYLSVRYSHPEWLVRLFTARLGAEEAERLLAADNEEPATVLQVNTLKVGAEALLDRLQGEGIPVQPHPWLEGCLTLTGGGDLEALRAFQAGEIYVQDAGARLAVIAAAPQPGMRVLDACGAPGGKSFAAGVAMGDKGEILCCDIHPHKKKLIDAGAARLGLHCVNGLVQDARTFRPEWEEHFDLVIADVPCSGLGIIRKKPDIRYKAPEPLEGLPEIQGAVLENVSRYVKKGGTLLYCTCTLLERENEAVIGRFLASHRDFRPEPFQLPGPVGRVEEGALTLWPHIHGTDGFYMAKLRRIG